MDVKKELNKYTCELWAKNCTNTDPFENAVYLKKKINGNVNKIIFMYLHCINYGMVVRK